MSSVPLRLTDRDPLNPARSRDSILARWICPLLLVAGFAVLTSLRVGDEAGRMALPTRWLTVGLLVFGGWTCPPLISFGVTVLTLSTWCWIESSPTPQWLGLSLGQLIRFAMAIWLVWWSHRIRYLLHRSHQLARIDNLTGLPNRQALIEAIESELSRTRRFGRPFVLVLLDCDGFKGINDQLGHLAGDRVLRQIADALRQQTRRYDCIGRLGGDEFLLVLSEVDQPEAELIIERLRATLRHCVERDFPTLKFSMGVVTFRTGELDWESCIQRVDEAMYSAKRQGPDQTRFGLVDAPRVLAVPK